MVSEQSRQTGKLKVYARLLEKWHTERPVRFVLVPAGCPAPDGTTVSKRISFIRHGQGEHNLHAEVWRAEKQKGSPYGPDRLLDFPHLVDPPLTPLGVEQATALQQATMALQPRPQIVVVSPLRRAVDTAVLAFKPILGEVRIVGQELCREDCVSRNICDKRRPLSEIAAEFSFIDWSHCEGGEGDLLYERGGETRESLAERAYKLMMWMAARPETTMAVACHSGFLLALFNAVLETDDGKAKSWFETGEMRTLDIAIVGNPVPHAPLPIISSSSGGGDTIGGGGQAVATELAPAFPSVVACVLAAATGMIVARTSRSLP